VSIAIHGDYALGISFDRREESLAKEAGIAVCESEPRFKDPGLVSSNRCVGDRQ